MFCWSWVEHFGDSAGTVKHSIRLAQPGHIQTWHTTARAFNSEITHKNWQLSSAYTSKIDMPCGYQFCRCGAAPFRGTYAFSCLQPWQEAKTSGSSKRWKAALRGLSHQRLPFLLELVNHAAMHVSCVGFESGARTMQPVFPGAHLQGGFPQAFLQPGQCRWQTKEKSPSTFDPLEVYKLQRVHVIMNESIGILQSPSAHAAGGSTLCHLLQVFPPWSRRGEQIVPGKSCLWMCKL